jgi:hypothetical protein
MVKSDHLERGTLWVWTSDIELNYGFLADAGKLNQ